MGVMDAYDSHRLSEPKGWNDDVVTPDEVRVCLDEIDFGGGFYLSTTSRNTPYARVCTTSGRVIGFSVIVGGIHNPASYTTAAYFPPVISEIVDAWLATDAGRKAIDDAMEDAE
jgi:hypothetical protein